MHVYGKLGDAIFSAAAIAGGTGQGSPVEAIGKGWVVALWKVHPVADPRDSRWQGRRIWSEVVVRARSAAMARLIASRLEEEPGATPVGNESLGFRSGFEDEKLYWAVRLNAEHAAAMGSEDGPEEIIRAIVLADHQPRCSATTVRSKEDQMPRTPEAAEPVQPVACNEGPAGKPTPVANSAQSRSGSRHDRWDIVDEASIESFPASDPPAWIWRAPS